MQFRPYPVLTVLSLLALVLLVLFGNWQYGRYQDKLARRLVTPNWQVISGEIIPGSTRLVYVYDDGRAGWREVAAADLGTEVVYLPRRVWFQVDPPALPPETMVAAREAFTARGTFRRAARRNAFTAADTPETGLFYTFDPATLGAGLAPADASRLRADVFEPDSLPAVEAGVTRDYANPFARPEALDRLPPERHFGYAITWWGLAAALVGVYFALHHQRGRLRFRAGDAP